jgi:hydrogenase maturation protein HypF
MLAYTPLHALLLDLVRRPLVMTSANLSEEPIAAGVEEARARLAGIADAFLWHDREIVARIDDSVMRVAGGAPVWMRRARGYAPLPLALPVASPRPLLAVGPHLKSTLTLAVGDAAYVSQHIGDLDNLETLEHWRATLDRYARLHRIAPEAVAHDLHPGYLSTRVAGELAAELGLERVIPVQHHHAHVAAVMAEHGRTAPVIGLAWDGTGYGPDGAVWGAEAMLADLAGFRRLARLRYAPLPGGDLAARSPWRVALGYLSLEPALERAFALAFRDVDERERAMAAHQTARRLNAPLAGTMGRLFDAAAAVLGVRRIARYEGQAAMELEALAGRRAAEPVALGVTRGGDGEWVLDPLPLLAMLGERAQRGGDLRDLAAVFHESIVDATALLAERMRAATGVHAVALGGGSFQNARLLTTLGDRLRASGMSVLTARALPPNDGAVSYGQAAVAAAVLRSD